MARRTSTSTDDDIVEKIVDIDVEEEMQGAFLEYAYSVIYSRALPDARDGLKPVQRRILFGMSEMGLRPTRPHVKSARIVGEVMGRYHPHGDSAIYDALVRMAQPFSLRLPLVDGHGNFGSLDDGPAASRYTEARPASSASLLTTSLDEDTVDLVPNYDETLHQPEVLPAAYPNLLVNGASGIAVGMATNMPPHNLSEVVGACRHLIDHPEATLEDLMRFVPGPDLPGGGRIVGLNGIRDAYETGRGTFKTRATTRIENVTPRKKGIVVTELPYLVGAEKVMEKIKDLVQAKKLQGISDLKDLTDRKHGLRLVIEIKNGFNPEAVLEQLYRLTPMEDSFGINNVALVDGQPRTLGLRELLQVYVDFRTDVVRRRTAYRLARKEERLHLVEGLLLAIVNIDEVIRIVRAADDTSSARDGLMSAFSLSTVQADYILELQLRRLTKFSKIELEKEDSELRAAIEELQTVLADHALLLRIVSDELAAVAKEHGTARRTVLLEGSGSPVTAAAPLEIADDPCWVLMSSTHLLARTTGADEFGDAGERAKHDAIVSRVRSTARGEVGVATSAGRILRLSVLELPTLPPTHGSPHLAGGAPLGVFLDLPKDEWPLCLVSLAEDSPGLAVGTAQGVVKRVTCDYPSGRADWEYISLKQGDRVVGAVELAGETDHLVFVTRRAQLLHFPASSVRPQGRPAGGMAGIKLGSGDEVIWFGAVDPARPGSVVVTSAGAEDALPGIEPGSLKVAPFTEFPGKGRATGGVRCQRFLRGETRLFFGWAGHTPARAATSDGSPIVLPAATGKRDGSGQPAPAAIAAIAPAGSGPVPDDDGGTTPGGSPSSTDGGVQGEGDLDTVRETLRAEDARRVEAARGRSSTGGQSSPEKVRKSAPIPGLAAGDSLFEVEDHAPRVRPQIVREGDDPDDLSDIVQIGRD
ncbi:DNA gyrase subunit A [Austwickia chelonae]|uniref:DNA topoisomerase (ATP-hydrolyzing) n=1 Tax=Austwickia chelonae NBRC 105200 TaxID=1184607 RepID=K6ULW7_9MICO|nr:DNA topoisomerase IV subunit A [Austwickia chelonae]GAB77606.1 putative type II topoisomerase [Austwickia chelonae NBRC 105200]SEW13951.1 DNA gyrase subunit A [Austwickia chelonae]